MSIGRLPPKQFNFLPFWSRDFKHLRGKPEFVKALGLLKGALVGMAGSRYADFKDQDPELAREEYDLEVLEASVRIKNLHYLREHFDGIDLYPLMLAIAGELHPDMKWNVLICEESAVVTNEERSLVFDLKNFDRLSGGASLLYVEDEKYEGTPAQQAEADRLIDAQIQIDLQHDLELQAEDEQASGAYCTSPESIRPTKPDPT